MWSKRIVRRLPINEIQELLQTTKECLEKIQELIRKEQTKSIDYENEKYEIDTRYEN